MATNRLGAAEFNLTCADGELTTLEPSLEVSLDCYVCQRRLRTIVFESLGSSGRCTPTGHEFPGVLTGVTRSKCGGHFDFRYRYEPFMDLKYPDEWRYQGFQKGAPTWARANFTVRCKRCRRVFIESSQSNMHRPWRRVCDCGAVLYLDVEPPRLSWSESVAE